MKKKTSYYLKKLEAVNYELKEKEYEEYGRRFVESHLLVSDEESNGGRAALNPFARHCGGREKDGLVIEAI